MFKTILHIYSIISDYIRDMLFIWINFMNYDPYIWTHESGLCWLFLHFPQKFWQNQICTMCSTIIFIFCLNLIWDAHFSITEKQTPQTLFSHPNTLIGNLVWSWKQILFDLGSKSCLILKANPLWKKYNSKGNSILPLLNSYWCSCLGVWYISMTLVSEAEKPRRHIGIADRKVFARPESFCVYLHNWP